MRYLLVILFSFFTTWTVAHDGEKHFNLGDRAQALKDEGKGSEIHPSLSEIRKMHPEFLYHKRDKTLRQGVRTRQNSLKACVNCHASNDNNDEPIAIDAEGQFCATCHQKVGTSLDCFSCHRSTPKEDL